MSHRVEEFIADIHIPAEILNVQLSSAPGWPPSSARNRKDSQQGLVREFL
jgi:hypothetical protein